MRSALALLVLLGGCATAVAPADGDTGALFPHPEGYSRIHMEDALEHAAACMGCHFDPEADGVEPVAPPCDTCHRWSAYDWYQQTEGGR